MANDQRRAIFLNDLLCFDLYATSRAVMRAYGPLLAQLELTYPQFLVMIALWEREPLGVKDLAERLSLDSGTLSPLLKRLETQGLLKRSRGTKDEREVTISLTPQGRAMKAKAPTVCDAMGRAFDMTPEQMSNLQRELRRIQKRMADS